MIAQPVGRQLKRPRLLAGQAASMPGSDLILATISVCKTPAGR